MQAAVQKKYMWSCPKCNSRFFSEPVSLGVKNGQLGRIHPICPNCFGKCRAGHEFGYGEICNVCSDPRRRFNLIRHEIDPDDPTFGMTSTGSATYPTTVQLGEAGDSATDSGGWIANYARAQRVIFSVPGTVNTLGVKWDGTAWSGHFALALYTNNGGTKPAALLTNSASTAPAGVSQWQDVAVTPYYVDAGTYWIAINGDATYCTNGTNSLHRSYYAKAYGTWDATWSASSTDDASAWTIALRATFVKIKNYAHAYKVTFADLAKSVTSISFYTHATGNFYVAIYTDSGGPAALVWTSGSTAASATTWNTVLISAGTPSSLTDLAAGDYWLGWQWDSVNAGPSYAVGGANTGAYLAQAYGAFPNPMTGETLSTENWSLYITYVAYVITGVIREAGTPIASATVWLFKTSDKSYQQVTTSDGSGNYTFNVADNTTAHFIRAFKDGSPNLFGVTDDDLVGA